MTVCEPCLRHSHLIAHLAPRIAGLLDRPLGRPSGILELEENELIARVASPSRVDQAHRFVEHFDADRALEQLVNARVSAVCRHATQYPSGVMQLHDPPRVIYCTGSADRLVELTSEPAATIVGTRRASPYGAEVAHELARGLAVAEVTVVSGLALGIDAAAHRGALEGGGRPIAVLACGADLAYPTRHLSLYQRVRQAGAVVSELPPGQRPFRWSFPARNRIMAALGIVTVVVEAADPSGSLITAGFANDLGRTVGAVPGRITSRVAAGSNRLLRDGACPIRGVEDVLDEIFGIGNGPNGPRASARRWEPDLEPRLRAVLDGVESGRGVGEIAATTGLPVTAVRAALGELELRGLIVAGAVGWYERVASG